MRLQIYKAICERLTAQVLDIKHLDLWNNNIAVLSGGAVWPRPAVFVEFETIEWKQLQNRARMADIAVRLHIVTDAVSYNGSTDTKQDTALAFFNLLNRVNSAMQGLKGENFAGFMLTTSATNHDHAELIESVERYVTRAQDTTAMLNTMQNVGIANVNIKQNNNPAT